MQTLLLSAPRTRSRLAAAVLAAVLGACMTGSHPPATAPATPPPALSPTAAIVRYQVADAARSFAFYTERLGFQPGPTPRSPAFASVVRGQLNVLLGGPGTSGSRPMPDGRRQEPGGWNRIVLYVDDLQAMVTTLRAAGVRFRNEVETGAGGSQIQIEDPDGNPIELHEAPGRR